MKLRFSESDIKKSTIVDTNWYTVLFTDYNEKKSNNGDWINCYIEGKILSDNPKFNEVPILKVIPEMMTDEQIKLCRALADHEEIDTKAEYQLSKAIVGTKLLAFIKPGQDNKGTIRNNIEQWAPESYLSEIEAKGGHLG